MNKEQKQRALDLLAEASAMLLDLKNEGCGQPFFWQVKGQYVAMGREIYEFLAKLEERKEARKR